MTRKENVKQLFFLLFVLVSCLPHKKNGGLLTNGESKTWRLSKLIMTNDSNAQMITIGAAMPIDSVDIFYEFSEEDKLFIYGLFKTEHKSQKLTDTCFIEKTKWKYELGEVNFATRDELPNIWKLHSFIIKEITDTSLIVHSDGIQINFVAKIN